MVIAKNKKSTWEYKIIDEFVTGIVLFGSEMKPIRKGKKLYDKRETVKARDTKIDIDRESKKY